MGCCSSCSCHMLAPDEQLAIETCTDYDVKNGPGFQFVGVVNSVTRRKAFTLSATQYCLIENGMTGERRVEAGPQIVFLQKYETCSGPSEAITLSPVQYCRVESHDPAEDAPHKAGDVRIVRGPMVFFPGPYDSISKKTGGASDDGQFTHRAVNLDQKDFLLVEDMQSGHLRIVRGPSLFFPGPFDKFNAKPAAAVMLDKAAYVIVENVETGELRSEIGPKMFFPGPYDKPRPIQKALNLGPTQYVMVEDMLTGDLRNEVGPRMLFPGPYDRVNVVKEAISLAHNEYTRIQDDLTGKIRVVRGQTIVYLSPTERTINPDRAPKIEAIEVDKETAVLVRNSVTAELRLETTEQLFFPEWNEQIEKVQRLVHLADHEEVIIRDREGRYSFRSGADKTKERAFFLPPYSELVTLHWSSGILKEKREDKVTKIDLRPQFMTYEFTCRTCDNVEIELDVTLFWQVVSVERMIRLTDDAPGDICHHARSMVIAAVSHVDLKKLMYDFNPIVNKCILGANDPFYEERGVVIHTVEVRTLHCKDPSTEAVLQQIIQETTNRMNRLQKQESENEVKLFKIKGEIEEEKLNGELLQVRHAHHRDEALMEGEAEADRIKAFITGLAGCHMETPAIVQLYHAMRKFDTLNHISDGNAHLYFTPADVNLSIETLEAAGGAGASKRARAARSLEENPL